MIKIGITGHRNLEEVHMPYYRDKVYAVLAELKEKDEEILIYSALADGADRLVVEVSMELDIDYIAILPMPKELYMTDYDKTSKIIYNKLFDNAISVIELPLVQNNVHSTIITYPKSRDLQYQAAGFFISDHCDILMALWDGEYTQLTGGTWDVIKYHLAKVHCVLCHLLVSRTDGVTKDMVGFKIYER